MYLKYQKEEDTWNIYDTANPKKLLFTKEPKKELFINNIIVEGVAVYPFSQNMDSEVVSKIKKKLTILIFGLITTLLNKPKRSVK